MASGLWGRVAKSMLKAAVAPPRKRPRDPDPDPKPRLGYPVGIVGESNYQEAIRRCRPGDKVTLVREAGNPHDARAIAVLCPRGSRLGYIAKESWLQDAVHRQGKGCSAAIESIDKGEAGMLGVVIWVKLTRGPLAERGFLGMIALAATLALLALTGPSPASAHPGGLAADGCHRDRSTGTRHCHGAGAGRSARSSARASSRGRGRAARGSWARPARLLGGVSDASGPFSNCAEARAAGAAPVREGDPGYSRRLDRDGDGVGCE